MSETIVVGVSESPVSRRAVDWAIGRAVERRLGMELVSVVGGAVGVVGEKDVLEAAIRDTRERLDEHVRRASDAGIQASGRVETGDPVSVLLEASKNAALLVIGSDYRGPDAGPARGVHGIRIAAAASSPVVVVPDVDLGDRRGIVVGVDGSEVSERALAFAAQEADRFGEPLIAVCVWTPLTAHLHGATVRSEVYLTNMQALAEESLALSLAGIAGLYPDLQVERHAERGYPSQVINRHAATARLAVVGTHGRGAVGRFLLGSISQEVLTRLVTTTAVVR
ncbi:universal stress protein [Microbacterium sp. 18062]|uniref:universal stress protein n=1 Tax=Microbacterium sp. 18062 TaxID=2681410 RepID=UPI00135C41B4|nr:universal stress protein [Microbacterium sp. 18062]